jgi:6-pyruvoyltetrahydropterin/6-carboxytetrahydropterin synthase
MKYQSTKIIELGSCAFRQWRAESHCKFIHGYRLTAKFWFFCNELDDKGWVVDFGALDNLKSELQKMFDHTTCIALDDPYLKEFENLAKLGIVDLRVFPYGVGIEKFTREAFNIANKNVKAMTNDRCWVTRVEMWEHEKNSAIYEEATAITSISVGSPVPAMVSNSAAGDTLQEQPQVNNPVADNPRAAPLYTKKSSGYSNLFGGTSWGNK